MTIPIGFTLQPELELLERTAHIAQAADYLEIAPETTWTELGGELVPNDFFARFRAAHERWGIPCVAHGVGVSMGTADPSYRAREARWLARMREDVRAPDYRWWTDHLGASTLAGQALTLPMPIPMTAERAAIVRARLDRMAEVAPEAGVENTVVHFVIGDPLDEPRFLREALGSRHHLLLDLHNLFTMSLNLGFEPSQWLARCDLSRVIEIHVSGGSMSEPEWLPSRRSLRLDGHDAAVPEPVWALLEQVLPHCPSLRGVTLERMEGTVRDERAVRELEADMTRLMTIAASA